MIQSILINFYLTSLRTSRRQMEIRKNFRTKRRNRLQLSKQFSKNKDRSQENEPTTTIPFSIWCLLSVRISRVFRSFLWAHFSVLSWVGSCSYENCFWKVMCLATRQLKHKSFETMLPYLAVQQIRCMLNLKILSDRAGEEEFQVILNAKTTVTGGSVAIGMIYFKHCKRAHHIIRMRDAFFCVVLV